MYPKYFPSRSYGRLGCFLFAFREKTFLLCPCALPHTKRTSFSLLFTSFHDVLFPFCLLSETSFLPFLVKGSGIGGLALRRHSSPSSSAVPIRPRVRHTRIMRIPYIPLSARPRKMPPRLRGLNAGVAHAGCLFIAGGFYPLFYSVYASCIYARYLLLFSCLPSVLFLILSVRSDVIRFPLFYKLL